MMELVRVRKATVEPLTKAKDYELPKHYVCNREGQVYKVKEETDSSYMCVELSSFQTRDGYVEYILTDNHGKKKHVQAHRLVASLFLPGYRRDFQVNHKNGKRNDNRASNLEFLSRSDNLKHSYDKLDRPRNNQYTVKKKRRD